MKTKCLVDDRVQVLFRRELLGIGEVVRVGEFGAEFSDVFWGGGEVGEEVGHG